MATLFIADSKIAASLLPFDAMGQNPTPSSAKLSEQVGKFVAQCAIDFARVLYQEGIQCD